MNKRWTKVAYRRIKGECYSIYVEGEQHVTNQNIGVITGSDS